MPEQSGSRESRCRTCLVRPDGRATRARRPCSRRRPTELTARRPVAVPDRGLQSLTLETVCLRPLGLRAFAAAPVRNGRTRRGHSSLPAARFRTDAGASPQSAALPHPDRTAGRCQAVALGPLLLGRRRQPNGREPDSSGRSCAVASAHGRLPCQSRPAPGVDLRSHGRPADRVGVARDGWKCCTESAV
jgi:hypothetical protein